MKMNNNYKNFNIYLKPQEYLFLKRWKNKSTFTNIHLIFYVKENIITAYYGVVIKNIKRKNYVCTVQRVEQLF